MTKQAVCVVYIIEKHVRQHGQNTTFGLFVEASLFRLTGWFHIHLFYHLRYHNFLFRLSKNLLDFHNNIH